MAAMTLCAVAFCAAHAAPALSESQCGIIPRKADGTPGKYQVVGDLKVLEVVRRSETFTVDPDLMKRALAIMCIRSSAVPEPTDFEVVEAGMPFYIAQDEPELIVVLERHNGLFRVRAIDGQLTSSQQTAADASATAANRQSQKPRAPTVNP